MRDPASPQQMVLSTWPSGGWDVQQHNRLAEVRFPGANLTIVGLPALKRSLPDGVLEVGSEVRGSDTFLRFTMGCDCTITLNGTGQSELQIEVLGDTSSSAPDAVAVDAKPASVVETAESRSDTIVAAATQPAPVRSPIPVARKTNLSETEALAADTPVEIQAARDRLIEQLVKAAESGLIEFDNPDPVSEVADVVELAETKGTDPQIALQGTEAADTLPVEDAAQGQAAEPPGASEHGAEPVTAGLQQTGDTDLAADADKGHATGEVAEPSEVADVQTAVEPAPVCYQNEVFALPEFAAPEDFVAYIAEHRAALVGEFDRIVPEAALKLARGYLAGGLGLEARKTLETFAPETEQTAILTELAHVLEDKVLPASASILREDCLGDQAVWRAYLLAKRHEGKAAVEAELSAGRALERLPGALREDVAAWIGFAASQVGEWDAARRLEAMAIRAGTLAVKRHPRSHLLSARLAEWRGDENDMLKHLEDVRTAQTAPAAEALLWLAEHALAGEDTSGEWIDGLQADLASLAIEARGTDLGERAFELELRLFDRANSDEATLGLLARAVESGVYPPDKHYALLSEVMSEPGPDVSDEPLAMTFMNARERLEPALDQPEFRREVALSMAQMGAPALTAEVLRPGDLADPALAATLAQAYLDGGDARQALEIAGNLPESTVRDALLGKALLLTGRDDQALMHLVKAAEEPIDDPAERLEILAGQALAASRLGDFSSEYSAREAQLTLAPSVQVAERLGLLALELGRNSLPDEARSVLAAEAPQRLAVLELLMRGNKAAPQTEDMAAVTSYLEELDAEAAMIEELLNDG